MSSIHDQPTTHGKEILIQNRKVYLQPLRNRLEVIKTLQPPKRARECRSFTGMVNLLSMICPELQKLLKPIYDLTRKEDPSIGKKNIKSMLIKPHSITYAK